MDARDDAPSDTGHAFHLVDSHTVTAQLANHGVALGTRQLANFHQVREPARPRNLICQTNRFRIREVQRALKTRLMELCALTEFNKALRAVQYIKHGLRRAERLLSCKRAARVLGIAAPSIR